MGQAECGGWADGDVQQVQRDRVRGARGGAGGSTTGGPYSQYRGNRHLRYATEGRGDAAPLCVIGGGVLSHPPISHLSTLCIHTSNDADEVLLCGNLVTPLLFTLPPWSAQEEDEAYIVVRESDILAALA